MPRRFACSLGAALALWGALLASPGAVLADDVGATDVAPATRADAAEGSWLERARQKLVTIWNDGRNELYVPLETYHLRSAYTREKIDSFNETPLGLGLGRGIYDADGDWHGLYAMGFQDSHYKPEYMVGYGYKTYWRLAGELKFGLGYSAFLTARADIGRYTPIPGILPLASLEYRDVSFDTAYVPGGRGNGNILFFWGKVRF